jgi:hypothetical protein
LLRPGLTIVTLPSFLLGILLFQGPGDGWALVPETRQVKKLYWEVFQTTEVWVRLIPEDPAGKPPLVSLIFQAYFPGRPERDPYTGQPRDPKGAPSKLVLRAQPLPMTVVSQLTLKLVIDGKTVDLTAPGAAYHYLYPCQHRDECGANAIAADIDAALLRALVTAKAVKGEALGFAIRLTAEDERALAEFAERVGVHAPSGSTIQP